MGTLVDRWPSVVGAAIARNAWPSRIGHDGSLRVNTSDGIWAFELTQRAGDIARRLGVPAVRFAPGPLAMSDETPPPAPAPDPSPEQLREAAAIVAAVASEQLRETIQRALSLSLARDTSDRTV